MIHFRTKGRDYTLTGGNERSGVEEFLRTTFKNQTTPMFIQGIPSPEHTGAATAPSYWVNLDHIVEFWET